MSAIAWAKYSFRPAILQRAFPCRQYRFAQPSSRLLSDCRRAKRREHTGQSIVSESYGIVSTLIPFCPTSLVGWTIFGPIEGSRAPAIPVRPTKSHPLVRSAPRKRLTHYAQVHLWTRGLCDKKSRPRGVLVHKHLCSIRSHDRYRALPLSRSFGRLQHYCTHIILHRSCGGSLRATPAPVLAVYTTHSLMPWYLRSRGRYGARPWPCSVLRQQRLYSIVVMSHRHVKRRSNQLPLPSAHTRPTCIGGGRGEKRPTSNRSCTMSSSTALRD